MSSPAEPKAISSSEFFDRQKAMFDSSLSGHGANWPTSGQDIDREFDQMRKDMMFKFETGTPTVPQIKQQQQQQQQQQHQQQHIVVGDSGSDNKFCIRVDCEGYKPEEIEINVVDKRKLQVRAKHESESEGRKTYRQFEREFTLPDGVKPEQLTSKLTGDGMLQIEAPVCRGNEAPKEILVPIEKMDAQ